MNRNVHIWSPGYLIGYSQRGRDQRVENCFSRDPERSLRWAMLVGFPLIWRFTFSRLLLPCPHLAFGTDGTWALGDLAQLPVALEFRPATYTACILRTPQPLWRNAEMRNLMPYAPAISSIARLAGTLKSGSRYRSLATHDPFYIRQRQEPCFASAKSKGTTSQSLYLVFQNMRRGDAEPESCLSTAANGWELLEFVRWVVPGAQGLLS